MQELPQKEVIPDFLWLRIMQVLNSRYETSIDYIVAALLAILFPPAGGFVVVPQCRLREEITSDNGQHSTYFEALVNEWQEKFNDKSKLSSTHSPPSSPPSPVDSPSESCSSASSFGHKEASLMKGSDLACQHVDIGPVLVVRSFGSHGLVKGHQTG